MSDTPAAEQQMTFDRAAVDRLRSAALEVLARHPEVRSVATAIDYAGPLNDAAIMHGVWVGTGENNGVVTFDAVVGSMFQTLKLLSLMFDRGFAMAEHLRERIQVLATEAVRKNEELKAQEKLAGAKPAGPA